MLCDSVPAAETTLDSHRRLVTGEIGRMGPAVEEWLAGGIDDAHLAEIGLQFAPQAAPEVRQAAHRDQGSHWLVSAVAHFSSNMEDQLVAEALQGSVVLGQEQLRGDLLF